MNKALISTIFLIAIGLSSSFAFENPAQKKAEELAKYKQTGEFENCISRRNIDKTVILDDQNIIFEMKNDKYMLNTFNTECKSLAFEKQFSLTYENTQLCKSSIVSTRLGTCLLGGFQILDKLPSDS